MLEDQLFLPAVLKYDGILVVAAHLSGDSGAIQQIHGHVTLGLACSTEKRFLNTGNGHGLTQIPPDPIRGGTATDGKNSVPETICPIYNLDVFNRN